MLLKSATIHSAPTRTNVYANFYQPPLPITSTMISTQPQLISSKLTPDPFVDYSRSLHDYTLRLWTESRRLAEEKLRAKELKKEAEERRRNGRSESPQSDL